MTTVFAVDPGTNFSAWVVLTDGALGRFGRDENSVVRRVCEDAQTFGLDGVVLEEVVSYGMPIGADVLKTVFWTGRFYDTLVRCNIPEDKISLTPRLKVKLHHCHSSKANDSTVRAALIDRFGPGKDKAVGVKAAPGPLYRVRADVWAALALGLMWWDLNKPDGYREG